jgi:sensor histidine kinase YesM
MAVFTVYTVLLIYTQCSTTIYYYDELNTYHRGPWYPVLLILPIQMSILNIGLLWSMRDRLSKEQKIVFASYIMIPVISMIIQMLFYGVRIIVLGASIAAFIMLTSVINDQRKQYYMQPEENNKLKTDILLSQIQPHFLFNTLGTIDSLCEEDPALAQKVIRQLSQYMSRNLRTFSDRQLIPFREEMEQVTLYLKIMQVRFPNIRLESELGSEEFYLPPLSVQLLVENAVLHGICKRRRSEGTVRITSAKLAHGYRVTVEDNGVGFSGELPADGKKHIGIENVSRRLETLCGGSLVIRGLPGEGTLCIIRVPESCGTYWRGERRADKI